VHTNYMKDEYINNLIQGLPLVTDFPSRQYWEAAIWEIICYRLSKTQSETELKRALRFLLTTGEQRDIIYRALAASRILSGIGSREIGRELWISRQTISAIKKSLDEGEYKSSHGRGHIKKEYTPSPRQKFKRKYPLSTYDKIRGRE